MSPELIAYYAARRRCNDPKYHAYSRYGGRGIKFLFDSFYEFFAEVGTRPSDNHSLDRKETDGHYEKGNLRWATRSEQMNNRKIKNYGRPKKATQIIKNVLDLLKRT